MSAEEATKENPPNESKETQNEKSEKKVYDPTKDPFYNPEVLTKVNVNINQTTKLNPNVDVRVELTTKKRKKKILHPLQFHQFLVQKIKMMLRNLQLMMILKMIMRILSLNCH